jgi:RNA polymerase sigma factor (TIGR02999 family)
MYRSLDFRLKNLPRLAGRALQWISCACQASRAFEWPPSQLPPTRDYNRKVPEILVHVDVSQLLVRWSAGDETALQELMPAVYAELRRLGRSTLRREARESILQPTALVHEAWIRMAGKQHLSMESRKQFYGLAAKMMRDILVDHARRRRAAKRGGSQIEIALDDANPSERPHQIDFLILDEAMTRLGGLKPRYARIAELRYMAGLTIDETAEVLSVSRATIEREWGFARAWLRRELQAGSHNPLP